jgi:hypothetical protein
MKIVQGASKSPVGSDSGKTAVILDFTHPLPITPSCSNIHDWQTVSSFTQCLKASFYCLPKAGESQIEKKKRHELCVIQYKIPVKTKILPKTIL